jgi:hypothetical protein
MKIDRTRFLMLTSVIAAAAACTTAAVTASDGGTPNDNGDAGEGDAGQTPVADGAGADSAPPTNDGGIDGASVACLGAVGDASAACAPFALGGNQDAGPGSCLTSAVCNGIANVTGGVAVSIVACASADPTFDAGCVDLSSCVLTALGTACSDPSTVSTCGAIVAACGPDSGAAIADGGIAVTQASCQQYLSGLQDSARDGFSACMVEGSCSLVACATGLF